MQLSEKQITQYREIYKQRFGSDISRGEALRQGLALLNIMKLIYKPITKNDLQNLQERRRKENLDGN